MPISAKWKHKSSIHIGLIVFNGGVTAFFAKSVYAKQKLCHHQGTYIDRRLLSKHMYRKAILIQQNWQQTTNVV